MKKFLLALTILSGALLALLGYERLFAAKSMGGAATIGFIVIGAFFLLVLLTWALYDTRHRGKMSGLWLAGFSTVVSFLVLDLVAGWILIKPLSPALVPDHYVHHKLVPDSWSRIEQTEFSYVQRVNKLGLRGKETTVEKPAGVVRILSLGDSFAMGKGVPDEQTAAVLLEKLLNDRAAQSCPAKKFEVLNGAVDSYAPVLSNIALRRNLGKLHPDLIVENIDMSDLIQETAYRSGALREGDAVVAVPNEAEAVTATDRIRDWIDQHLFFTRAALYYISKATASSGEVSVREVVTHANHEIIGYTLTNDAVPRDRQWQDIFSSLSAMKTYADSSQADFLLSIYPWAHEISATEWVPGRYTYMNQDEVASPDGRLTTVRKLAAERGITVADAYDAFRRYQGTERLYYKQDMHWTFAGQQVMAQSMADYLEKNYWTKWCP